MNSVLRIEFQIALKNAQAMKDVRKEIEQISKTAKGSVGSFGALGAALAKAFDPTGVINFGKQMQWVGRQLEYNFTLPIVRAGRSIFGLAMQVEQANTNLIKVFDATANGADRLSGSYITMGQHLAKVPGQMSEVETASYKLGQVIRLLSDVFGVSMADVSDIAARAASAGARNVAEIAGLTQLVVEAMSVGDFSSSEDAFNALIQIQKAYGLTLDQLRLALATLNEAENITAASFTDLTTVMARAGGTANNVGVDISHLTAMAAALVPITGSAASAGNALKTMFSKLIAPTNDAVEAMAKVGVEFYSAEFQSKSATERIEYLSQAIDRQDGLLGEWASSIIFGRYQLNRASVLTKAVANATSDYNRVVEAGATDQEKATALLKKYNEELDIRLRSTPQGIKIMQERMNNLMQSIGAQLLPTILVLLTAVNDLVTKFTELDPSVQRMILLGVVALAAVGPIVKLTGAFLQLFGILGNVVKFLVSIPIVMGKAFYALGGLVVRVFTNSFGLVKNIVTAFARTVWARIAWLGPKIWTALTATFKGIVSAVGALLSLPPGWIVVILLALAGLIYAFRDQIGEALGAVGGWFGEVFGAIRDIVVNAFNAMPQAVVGAFSAIVRIVAAAVSKIREFLSYLNPFARHSPSLVESVVQGVAIIASQYASLANIGAVYRRAAEDLKAFKAATADAASAQQGAERGEQRASIVGASPSAGPAVDALFSHQDSLQGAMDDVTAAMDAQSAVVETLQRSFDALDAQVKSAQDTLDSFQETANDLSDQLSAAKERLEGFANAPLVGMKAMDDQIFANDMAIKQLRLDMMDMEDAVGPIDKLQNKLGLLQGDIEQLQGMQSSLRAGGAGSEITGPLGDQIDALEAQKDAIDASVAPLQEMQDQIDTLGRKAERLDLERSLAFDPLTRQIKEASEALEELPFDQVMAGVKQSKADVDRLTVAWNDANGKVAEQERVVKQLTAARDLQAAALDAEKQKLDGLKDSLSGLKDLYDQITKSLDDMATAAEKAARAKKEAEGSEIDRQAAALAASEEPGGSGLPEGIGGIGGDIDKQIEDLKRKAEEIGNIDWAAEFQKIWQRVKDWWNTNVKSVIDEMWDKFLTWWNENVGSKLAAAKDTLIAFFDDLKTVIGAINPASWWDDLTSAIGRLWDKMQQVPVLNGIAPVLHTIADGFMALVNSKAIGYFLDQLDRFGHTVADMLLTYLQMLWDMLVKLGEKFKSWGDIIEPLLTLLGRLGAALGILVGIAVQIVAVLLGAFMQVVTFLWDVLKPAFEVVWDFIVNTVGNAIDIVHGIILAVLGLLTGDWDVAWKGLQYILEGVWGAITGIIKFALGMILALFKGLGKKLLDAVIGFMKLVADWLNPFGGSPSIVDLVSRGIDAIVGFFVSLPGRALGALSGFASTLLGFFADAPSWLLDAGTRILQGVLDGLGWAWENLVLPFFTGLPQKVLDTVVTIGTWLLDKGKELLGGLLNGIIEKGPDLMQWWLDMPVKVLEWIGDAFVYLPGKGKDLLQGLLNGITSKAPDVWNWWKALPGEVVEKVGSVLETLKTKGTELLGSLLTGIAAKAPEIWNWFIGLPATIAAQVGSVLMTLWNTGWNLLQGLWDGIIAFIPTVWKFLTNLPQTIKDNAPDMSETLYKAGQQVMQSLIDGIQSFVDNDKLGAVLRGVSTYIPLLKGPPAADAVMLEPNGQLIMEGLVSGIRAGIPELERQLSGVSGIIRRSSMNVSLNGSAPGNNASVKTLTFNGDLSFPNITSGDDAKDFIRNLEAIAGT